MGIATSYPKYDTRPLACWPKMKELRRQNFWHIWKAKETGVPLIMGTAELFQSLPAGLGDFAGFGFGPYFGAIMRQRELATRCLEAVESRGLGRDICGICRVNLGSMYLGMQTKSPSGELVKPDFCLQIQACDPLAKATQLMSEYYGVPYFVLDIPHSVRGNTLDYLVNQMLEATEWMERVTGIRYDDEKLIQAVLNEWESMVLWARVCELQKAIPAPLDLRYLASLSMPMWTSKHKAETVSLLKILLSEVEERVRDGISARGEERCRLLHEGQWPWYYPRLLRLPEKYGAVFIGSRNIFGVWGAFSVDDQGKWRSARTPQELGVSLRNREQALKALTDLYMVNNNLIRSFSLSCRSQELLGMVEDWGVGGVIMNYDYACKGLTAGLPENHLALSQKRIPNAVYEACQADPRDFDESGTVDRIESFLDSLGLSRLPAAA